MDGTVFDTSEGRGPTPMIAGQVIPGFAEALTKMQKGGRYKIRIPAELGYGANPQPGSPIPPNADLVFDVELVDFMTEQDAQRRFQVLEQMMQQQQKQAGAPGAPAAQPGAPRDPNGPQ